MTNSSSHRSVTLAPGGTYALSYEVARPERTLYISGQIPVTRRGDTPTQFDEQCRLVWENLEAQLRAADMS